MGQDVGVPAAETPHLRGGREDAAQAVLVLHGGREHGRTPTSSRQLAYLRMLDIYSALRRASTDHDPVAAYVLRFRVRGWNAAEEVPDPVRDARYALDEIARRHPGAPVAIVGHSMGGRTGFAVSDHPSVVGVCGLAPWLPDGEPLPDAPALGRVSYVIAHGTADRMTSAPLSLEYALRLRGAGARVARFELPGAKHAMLNRPGLWRRLAVASALGMVGAAPLPAVIAAAFDSPANARLDDLSTDLSEVGL